MAWATQDRCGYSSAIGEQIPEGTQGGYTIPSGPYMGTRTSFATLPLCRRAANGERTSNDPFARATSCYALIGESWTTIEDRSGRRLDQENDPVRVEIATAIKQKKTLIPVLFDETKMPGVGDLPSDLQGLCDCTAYWMDDARWDPDFDVLTKSIDASRPDEKLSGAEIVARSISGAGVPKWMGRNGGFRGKLMQDDLSDERWRSQTYEVSHRIGIPNRQNWFPVSEFLARVQES